MCRAVRGRCSQRMQYCSPFHRRPRTSGRTAPESYIAAIVYLPCGRRPLLEGSAHSVVDGVPRRHDATDGQRAGAVGVNCRCPPSTTADSSYSTKFNTPLSMRRLAPAACLPIWEEGGAEGVAAGLTSALAQPLPSRVRLLGQELSWCMSCEYAGTQKTDLDLQLRLPSCASCCSALVLASSHGRRTPVVRPSSCPRVCTVRLLGTSKRSWDGARHPMGMAGVPMVARRPAASRGAPCGIRRGVESHRTPDRRSMWLLQGFALRTPPALIRWMPRRDVDDLRSHNYALPRRSRA